MPVSGSSALELQVQPSFYVSSGDDLRPLHLQSKISTDRGTRQPLTSVSSAVWLWAAHFSSLTLRFIFWLPSAVFSRW